ncbi:MAG: 16S rRNA (adenine(1518)-N(6)/adenine(1519)-N(6))-dimethyltransferase RsmA [Thiotrichales bacterium]|nr:16S rRNA (adenine(1518)-N(6)/adenine(1519)-N(6))-dimethyltransferase RsmA [Thiotrichales bacterium]MCY4349256.1 16S rRNA (adenine(1518)-N(6)/adenine(1519)-N(6))-dimethyltransferase RsmA [Thiotrichales bacterium]
MSRASSGPFAAPARDGHPRRRFAQHFLHDQAVIRRIIDAVAPGPDDLIVEVGPGRGALTFPMLASGCELHAIEIDRDLAARLRSQTPHHPNLTVHEADALDFDLDRIAPPPRRFRVIGNLPYNISTPLLFRFLASLPRITDMHLMLQKEVVERMASVPGTREYGRLSVMVQLDCEVERVIRAGPGAFHPAPRVESAVVRLRPRPHIALDHARRRRLETIVRACFSKRRKTLRNALRGICDERLIAAAGLDPRVRPEILSVGDFIDLARASVDRGDANVRIGGRQLSTKSVENSVDKSPSSRVCTDIQGNRNRLAKKSPGHGII